MPVTQSRRRRCHPLYWVGFGAGAGRLRIQLEFVDASGTAHYAIDSEADLAVGVFGGSMASVVGKAIEKATVEFGNGL